MEVDPAPLKGLDFGADGSDEDAELAGDAAGAALSASFCPEDHPVNEVLGASAGDTGAPVGLDVGSDASDLALVAPPNPANEKGFLSDELDEDAVEKTPKPGAFAIDELGSGEGDGSFLTSSSLAGAGPRRESNEGVEDPSGAVSAGSDSAADSSPSSSS